MISYDAIQDAVTAILVILIISFIISVAWLSTNVREQPLVAFVVFHSSNNGERDQTLRDTDRNAREAQDTRVRECEATPIRQTVEVDSKGHKEAKMNVKQTDDKDSSGNTCVNKTCDTNLLQVERVGNISVEEVAKDTGSALSYSQLKEKEDDVSGSAQNPDEENRFPGERLDVAPLHTSLPEREGDTIPETELRKRRLQQFISMGDTTTTTHLERLSEQLTATLPSEMSDQQSFTEDKKCLCNEGAQVEEVCNNESSTTDALSPSSNIPAADISSKEEEERPPGSIKIRLKFLDETQKYVFAQLTEQVGTFKRQHFSIEMDANRRIRLIFNGQLLSQDTSTLAQYGLFDNCVVHCHVSQPQQNSTAPGRSREAAAQDEEDAYVSRLLAPLLYGVLAVMWYLRYEYGHLFNAMSTLILLFLTALLLVSTYLLYVTHHLPHATTTTLPHPQTS